MENMNLSKNNVYGIPPAISSLLPVVLSYCQTHFSIGFQQLISIFQHFTKGVSCFQSISLCLALTFVICFTYFSTLPLVSNNFPTYFSLLPPLIVKPVSAFLHWFSPIDQHISASCQTVFQIYLSLAKAFVRLSSRFFGTFS